MLLVLPPPCVKSVEGEEAGAHHIGADVSGIYSHIVPETPFAGLLL